MSQLPLSASWVYNHYSYVLFFQRGDRLYTPESDVYRRHIVTSEVDPRAERVKASRIENTVSITE